MARNTKIKWLLVLVISLSTVLQMISTQNVNSTVLKTFENVSDEKNQTLPVIEPPKKSETVVPNDIQPRTESYGKIVSLLTPLLYVYDHFIFYLLF